VTSLTQLSGGCPHILWQSINLNVAANKPIALTFLHLLICTSAHLHTHTHTHQHTHTNVLHRHSYTHLRICTTTCALVDLTSSEPAPQLGANPLNPGGCWHICGRNPQLAQGGGLGWVAYSTSGWSLHSRALEFGAAKRSWAAKGVVWLLHSCTCVCEC